MKTRLLMMFIAASVIPAFSQSANYKSVETVSGEASQLDYFATRKKGLLAINSSDG
jgi:hypothetical protein